MDAIAHLHLLLDFNINNLRCFKCFNPQLVLPLQVSTTEEVYGVK